MSGDEPKAPTPFPCPRGLQVSVGQHPPHVTPRLSRRKVRMGLIGQAPNFSHFTVVSPPHIPPSLCPAGPRLRLPQPHRQVRLILGPRHGLTEAVHLTCGSPASPRCSPFFQRFPPRLMLQLPCRAPTWRSHFLSPRPWVKSPIPNRKRSVQSRGTKPHAPLQNLRSREVTPQRMHDKPFDALDLPGRGAVQRTAKGQLGGLGLSQTTTDQAQPDELIQIQGVLGLFKFSGELGQPRSRVPIRVKHSGRIAPQFQRPSGGPNEGQSVALAWFCIVHHEGPGPRQSFQSVHPATRSIPSTDPCLVDDQIGTLNSLLGDPVHPGTDVKGMSRAFRLARRLTLLVHPTDDHVGLAPSLQGMSAKEQPSKPKNPMHQSAEFHGKRAAKASGTNGRMSPPWPSTSRTTVEWIAEKTGSVKSITVSKSGCI